MDTIAAPSNARPARSRLFQELGRITSERPFERKRLVGPDINFGREALAALARETDGWIGWEAANLRGIAEALAFVPLAERGVKVGNDVEIGALINRALDQAIENGEVSPRVAALERSPGFRRAVEDAVLELRIAGIGAAALRRGTTPDSPAHDLPAVLDRYERMLGDQSLTDPAGVFAEAVGAFDREAPFLLDGTIFLIPTLGVHGLPGRLLKELIAYGAHVLECDPVMETAGPPRLLAGWRGVATGEATSAGEPGVPVSAFAWIDARLLPAADARLDDRAVTPDFFVASTPSEEVREVCRRVAAEGLCWDEVEIIATDVDTYGVALDALSQQLGMGVTMLHGVPLARTRIGRALERWFGWLEGGLPANVLRQALEAGELTAPDCDLVPTALAREVRRLRIGWGRARYESALEQLDIRRDVRVEQRDDESDDEHAARVDMRRRGNDGVARLLAALLAATPQVPELGSDMAVRISTQALARHTLQWLAMVPMHGAAEEQAASRLATRLECLAALDDVETSFSSALAALREALSDLRAWPMLTSERKPWSASGGFMHLTDLAHAGTTGRRRTFVVGLDAARAPGSGHQDPLLPDVVRLAVGGDELGTSVVRRREAGWLAAQALASLRGHVTLSYASGGSLDGRESGPAPLMLQAWRIHRHDATLSYEHLRTTLGAPACAVPTRAGPATLLLDGRDAWLDAIADGPLLLDATGILAQAFPMLANGLLAGEHAAGPALTAHHGLVPAAAAANGVGPGSGGRISPSALERLAACPLAWFYRYGLSLSLPEDPEYDAARWLDHAQRGSLLHEVYEAFTTQYRGRQREIRDDAALDVMRAIAERVIEAWRTREPPPGTAVFATEAAEIMHAAMSFLAMERECAANGDAGVWLHTELDLGDDVAAARYTLADGTSIAVKGKADRVDALPDGTLRVIDYKTGSASRFQSAPNAGAFKGGRQLQPAIYSSVVGALLGKRVDVFEYRFPTERGQNTIVAYSATALERARDIIAGLLDHVRAGSFVPTNDNSDCTYCDYRAICRAEEGRFETVSPRAAWAATHGARIPEYRTMLLRRGPGVVS